MQGRIILILALISQLFFYQTTQSQYTASIDGAFILVEACSSDEFIENVNLNDIGMTVLGEPLTWYYGNENDFDLFDGTFGKDMIDGTPLSNIYAISTPTDIILYDWDYLLTNSVSDFSTTQGANGWLYYMYIYNNVANTDMPLSYNNTTGQWESPTPAVHPELRITSALSHPSAANTPGDFEMAVRRWMSNFTGMVNYEGSYADISPVGDGQKIRIYHFDGSDYSPSDQGQIYNTENLYPNGIIPGPAPAPVNVDFSITIPITSGDHLDFGVDRYLLQGDNGDLTSTNINIRPARIYGETASGVKYILKTELAAGGTLALDGTVPTDLCSNDLFNLETLSFTDGANNYTSADGAWTDGDGNPVGDLSVNIEEGANDFNYSISGGSCPLSFEVSINGTTPPPGPSVDIINVFQCESEIVPINLTGDPGATLNWYDQDNNPTTDNISGTNNQTFTPPGPGQYFYFFSQTVDDCESVQGSFAVEVVDTPDTPEPTCVNETTSSIEITWPPIAGATDYEITSFINTNPPITTAIGANNFTFDNLDPGDQVSVTVTAIADGVITCTGAASPQIMCQTSDCPDPQYGITGIPSQVCSGDPIYGFTTDDPDNIGIGTFNVQGVPATWFDPALYAGQTVTLSYVYDDEVSGCELTAVLDVGVIAGPPTPQLTCVEQLAGSITVGWDPVVGADEYEITYTISSVGTPVTVLESTGVFTFTVDNLTITDDVTFNIVAIGTGTCVLSAVSETLNCNTGACPDNAVYGIDNIEFADFKICKATGPILLTADGPPEGGTFGGPGVTASLFNPAGLDPGIIELTYEYTDEAGCIQESSLSVLVEEPSAIPVPVCGNATTNLVEATWDPIPNATSYNILIFVDDILQFSEENHIPTDFVVSGLTAGEVVTFIVQANVTTSCETSEYSEQLFCPALACSNDPITFDDIPTEICEGVIGPISTSDDLQTGTFDGPGLVDEVFGIYDLSGLGGQMLTLTYEDTDENGCAESGTFMIMVEQALLTPVVNCLSFDFSSISINWDDITNADNYLVEYSINNEPIQVQTVGVSEFNLIGLDPGDGVDFTVTANGSGLCGNSNPSIEVNCTTSSCPTDPNPSTITNLASEHCSTEPAINLLTNGPIGTFSGPGVADTVFNPSQAGAGPIMITYSYDDENNCEQTSVTNLDIIEPLAVPELTCNGGSPTSININWDIIPGVLEYELTYSIENGPSMTEIVAGNGYELLGLSSGQIVEFTMASIGDGVCGNSAPSASIFCNAQECETIVGQFEFTGLQTEYCITDAAFDLQTNAPFDDGTYSGDGVVENQFIPAEAGVGTSFIDYTYEDEDGCFQIVTDSTTVVSALSTPMVFSGTSSTTSVSINWLLIDEATNYIVYYAINGGTEQQALAFVTEYEVSDLNPGDEVVFQVESTGSGICGNSDLSDPLPVTAQDCDENPDPYTIDIDEVPSEICSDSAPIELFTNDPDNDGTYGGDGVTDSLFNPIGLSGTVTLSYTYEEEENCFQQGFFDIQIVEPIEVPEPYCLPSTPTSISFDWQQITGPGVTGNNFVFYSLNGEPYIELSGPSVSSSFTLPDLEQGDSISFTMYAQSFGICGNSAQSDTLTCFVEECFPDPNPFTVNNLPDNICVNAEAIQLESNNPLGEGEFEGDGVTFLDGNYFFNPASVAIGSTNIEYEYTDVEDCPQIGVFSTNVVGPLEPPVLTCGNSTTNSISVDWGLVIGANDYTLTYTVNSDDPVTETVLGQMYEVTGLVPGDEVVFELVANGDGICGNSEVSNFLECTAQDCFIDPNPFTVISLPSEICVNDGNVDLETDNPTGEGTFGGDGVALFNGNYIFNPSNADIGTVTITYSYTNDAGCDQSGSVDIEVLEPLPQSALTCEDVSINSVTVSWIEVPNASGYTLTYIIGSEPSETIQSTDLEFELTGLESGDEVVFTIVANGDSVCGDSVQSGSVTCTTQDCLMNDSPPPFDLENEYCANEPAFELVPPVAYPDGTFSGDGINGNTFDPVLAPSGTSITITYDYTDENNCPQSTVDSTIIATPLETPILACGNSTTSSVSVQWQEIVGNEDYSISYTINGNDVVNDVTPSEEYEVTDLNPGDEVAFSVNAIGSAVCGNGPTSETTCIAQACVIDDSPFIITNLPLEICVTEGVIQLATDNQNSGEFSGDGANGNEFNIAALDGNEFDPAALDEGEYLITYEYDDENGCPQSSEASISVFYPIDEVVPFCENEGVNSIQFGWDEVSEGTGYIVEMLYDSGTETITINDPSETSYELTGLSANTTVEIFVTVTSDGVCGNTDGLEIVECTTSECIVPVNPFVINSLPTEICSTDGTFELGSNNPAGGGEFSGVGIDDGMFNPSGLTSDEYDLTYTYFDENNCEQEGIFSVTILAEPNVEITGETTICQGESLVLTETGGAAFDWTWTGPDNFEGLEQEMVIDNVTNANGGIYVITIADENGCTSTAEIEVSINPLPTVFFDSNMPVCLGQNLNLSEEGGDAVSWEWSGPDGFISDSQNPSIESVSNLNEGTYTVLVTDENGCTRNDGINVSFSDGITLMIQEAGPFCTSDGIQQLFGNPPSENWAGDINLDGTFDPSMGAGIYEIIYAPATDGPCSFPDTLYIEVFDGPTVDAGDGGTIDCTNTEVVLEGSIEDNTFDLLWTGPDVVSGETSLSPTVGSSGMYFLTVVDPVTNCSSIDSVEVFQDAAVPVANVTGGGTINCTGANSFLISGEGSSEGGGIVYTWTTEDGLIPPGEENLFETTVSQAGTYVLTVLNTSNNCDAVANVIIEEDSEEPNIEVVSEVSILCGNPTVVLSGSSITPNVEYLWTTDDGNIVSGADSPTPTVDMEGTYLLTITGENGCSSTADVSVSANAAIPEISISLPDTLTCGNTELELDLMYDLSLNLSFVWTTNDGNISAGANSPLPSVTSAGTYMLTATNLDNACVATASTTVIENVETPIVDAGTTQTICGGSAATLQATGGDTYIWNPGNLMGESITVEPTETTIFTVIVTNSSNNCSEEAMVTVEVIDGPNAGSGGDGGILCNDATEGLTTVGLTTDGDATGSWVALDGGPTIDNLGEINTEGADLGLFNYVYVIEGVAPCSNDSAFYTITVEDCLTACPNPATADAGLDFTVCQTGTIELNGVIGGGATSASWSSNGDGSFTDAAVLTTTYQPGSNDINNGSVTLILTTDDPDVGIDLCSPAIANIVITIEEAPDAGPDQDYMPICNDANEGVSSTTLSSNGGFWFAQDGGPEVGLGNIIDADGFTSIGTFTYAYVVEGIGICENDTALGLVTIEDCLTDCPNSQSVDAGADITICEIEFIDLNGIATPDPFDAFWTTNGDGTFPPDNTASATYFFGEQDSLNGTVTLTLQMPDPDGAGPCEEVSDELVVTIVSNPIANAGEDQTICAGETATLNATGGDSYSWNTSQSDESLIVSPTETTDYILTAFIGGCNSQDIVTVFVSDPPNAGLGQAVTVCNDAGEGESLIDLDDLLDTTEPGSWINLSGETLDADNVFDGAGLEENNIYLFGYVVEGVAPCNNDTAVFTISILDCATCPNPPVADFEYDAGNFCSGDTGIYLPVFLNGGNAGVFEATPTGLSIDPNTGELNIGASTSGSYMVTNSIAATAECPEVSTSYQIIINEALTVTDLNCSNTETSISIDWTVPTAGPVNGYEVQYSINGGPVQIEPVLNTLNSYTVNDLTPGDSVTLVVIALNNSNPCSSEPTMTCTIPETDCPEITFDFDVPSETCLDEVVNLSVTILEDGNVANDLGVWSGQGLAPGVNGIFDPNITGVGTYTLIHTYENGNCSASDSIDITVVDNPIAITSNGGPYCNGENIELFVEQVPGATYLWTGPEDYTSNLQNPSDAIVEGTYTCVVTLNGCGSEPSEEIIGFVAGSGVVLSTNSNLDICEGQSIILTFELTGTGPFEVIYTNGTSNFTEIDLVDLDAIELFPDGGESYSIVSATDGNGCGADVVDVAFEANVHQPPSFTNVTETCNASGETYIVNFEILEGNPDTYQVVPLVAGTIDGNIFTSTPINSGEGYNFLLTDDVNCSPVNVQGTADCGCVSFAGTMNQDLVEVCEGEQYSVSTSTDFVFDGDDTGMYILHDNPGLGAGFIFANNTDGSFSSDDAPGQLGVTLYISYVVGNDIGGEVDLTDPCLSVAGGTPIIFNEEPDPDAGPNDETCELTYQMNASVPVGLGTFTFGSGPGTAVFTNDNDPNTTVTVDAYGTYELIWTNINATCLGGDLVEITFIEQADIALPNIPYCEDVFLNVEDLTVLDGITFHEDDAGVPNLTEEITIITEPGTYWAVSPDPCSAQVSFLVFEECTCPTTLVNNPIEETLTVCEGEEIDLEALQGLVSTDLDESAVFNWYDEAGDLVTDLVFEADYDTIIGGCDPITQIFTLEIDCESDDALNLNGGTFTLTVYPTVGSSMFEVFTDVCVVTIVDLCNNNNLEILYSVDGGPFSNVPPELNPNDASVEVDYVVSMPGMDCGIFESSYVLDCPGVCPTEVIDPVALSESGCSGTVVNLLEILNDAGTTTDAPASTLYNFFNADGENISLNIFQNLEHSGGLNCDPEEIVISFEASCAFDTDIILDAGTFTFTVYPEITGNLIDLPLGCAATIEDLCDSGELIISYSTDNGGTFTDIPPAELEQGDDPIDVTYIVEILGNECAPLEGQYTVSCPENCPTTVVTPLGLEQSVCTGFAIDLQNIGFNVEVDVPLAAIYEWYDQDGNEITDPTNVVLEHSTDDCIAEIFVFDLQIACTQDPNFALDGGTATYTVYPEINEDWFEIPDENCVSEITVNCQSNNLTIDYSIDGGASYSSEPPVLNPNGLPLPIIYNINLNDGVDQLCGNLIGNFSATCIEACPSQVFDPLVEMTFVCSDEPNIINFDAYEALVTSDEQDQTVYTWIDEDGAVINPATLEFIHSNASCEPESLIIYLEIDCNSDFELNLPGGQVEIVIYPQPDIDWIAEPGNCETALTDLCGSLIFNYSTDGGTTFSETPPSINPTESFDVDYEVFFLNSPEDCWLTGTYTAECAANCPTMVVDSSEVFQAVCDGQSFLLGMEDLFFTDLPDEETWFFIAEDGTEIPQDTDFVFTHSGTSCEIDTVIFEIQVDCINDDNIDLFGGTWMFFVYPDLEMFVDEPIGCDAALSVNCEQEFIDDLVLVEYSTDGGTTYSETVPNNLNAGDPDVEIFYQVSSIVAYAGCVDFNGNYTVTCPDGCPTLVNNPVFFQEQVCQNTGVVLVDFLQSVTDNPSTTLWIWVNQDGEIMDEDGFLIEHSGTTCEPESFVFNLFAGCISDPTVQLPAGEISFNIYPSPDEIYVVQGDFCESILTSNCNGGGMDFLYSVDNGVTYSSNPPAALEEGDPEQTFLYTATMTGAGSVCPALEGSYTVTCPDEDCLDFFTIPIDTSLCSGSSNYSLQGIAQPSTVDGLWTIAESPPGSNPASIEDNNKFVIQNSDTGLYVLRFTPLEPVAPGCLPYSEESITVVLSPEAGVGSTQVLCQGFAETIQLYSLLSGNYDFGDWYIDSGDVLPENFNAISGTFDIANQEVGDYVFEYRVEGTGSCNDQSTYATIKLEGEVLEIAYQDNQTLCSTFPDSLIFNLNNLVDSINTTYTWEAVDNINIAEDGNVDFNGEFPGIYDFNLNIDDGCLNESFPVAILLEECVNRFNIPTAFSPNGDGLNDFFRPIAENVASIDLQIYDRWGEKVFETSDLSTGWDGTYNSDPVEIGVYLFYLKVTYTNGETDGIEGNVTLIR